MHLENRIHTSRSKPADEKKWLRQNDEKNQKSVLLILKKNKQYTRQVNQRYGLRDRMVTQKERRVDALALRADEGRD